MPSLDETKQQIKQIERQYKSAEAEAKGRRSPGEQTAALSRARTDAILELNKLAPHDPPRPVRGERWEPESALLEIEPAELANAQTLAGVFPKIEQFNQFQRQLEATAGDQTKRLALYFALREQGKSFFSQQVLVQTFERPATEYDKQIAAHREIRQQIDKARNRINGIKLADPIGQNQASAMSNF